MINEGFKPTLILNFVPKKSTQNGWIKFPSQNWKKKIKIFVLVMGWGINFEINILTLTATKY
jgi:hypothetical protein